MPNGSTEPVAEKAWFGDARVTRFARRLERARDAVLFFHGFPGQAPAAVASSAPKGPKLRLELAETLVKAADVDVFMPVYEGLGESRGTFTFARSVSASLALASEVRRRGYRAVHVIGHSWGAFVAVNAFAALGESGGRLVLLAGLLDLRDEGSVRDFISAYFDVYPEILGKGEGAFARAIRDLDQARRAFNPMAHAAALRRAAADRVLLIHGSMDAEVPVDHSRRFAHAAGARLIEVPGDHAFTGRFAEVIARAVPFLAGQEGRSQ